MTRTIKTSEGNLIDSDKDCYVDIALNMLIDDKHENQRMILSDSELLSISSLAIGYMKVLLPAFIDYMNNLSKGCEDISSESEDNIVLGAINKKELADRISGRLSGILHFCEEYCSIMDNLIEEEETVLCSKHTWHNMPCKGKHEARIEGKKNASI